MPTGDGTGGALLLPPGISTSCLGRHRNIFWLLLTRKHAGLLPLRSSDFLSFINIQNGFFLLPCIPLDGQPKQTRKTICINQRKLTLACCLCNYDNKPFLKRYQRKLPCIPHALQKTGICSGEPSWHGYCFSASLWLTQITSNPLRPKSRQITSAV